MENNMRWQVFEMPALLRRQYGDLEPKTRQVLSFEEIFSVQQVILTGCGDSHAAALACRSAFENLAGLPVQVLPALDLARFHPAGQLGTSPGSPLVIAVSNSGTVARVGEAIRRATAKGAFTLAVTGNPAGPLAQNARRVLALDIPPLKSAPGVCSYMVSCLSLLLLAIRMGEVKGRYTMDAAGALRAEILAHADAMEALLPQMDEQARNLAEWWAGCHAFDFCGAGIDFAAAFFAAAKMLEAVGKPALYTNTEEWMHLNYFLRDVEGTATGMFSNLQNPALSRVREVVKTAAEMGRPLVVFGDAGEIPGVAYEKIATPFTQTGYTMPLSQAMAPSLLAGYLCQAAGEEYGRGCKGPWAASEGGAGIKNSELVMVD